MFIYVLRDPTTNEIRYIGKTTKSIRARWYAHCMLTDATRQRHVHHWIKTLRANGKFPDVEEIARADSYEELNQLEIECIAFARHIGLRLTNISSGGDGSVGFKRSPETIAKMKAAQGSQEARARKSQVTRSRTPEFNKLVGQKHRMRIYCSDGRNFLGLTEAATGLGVSVQTINRALRGEHGRIFRKFGFSISRVPLTAPDTNDNL